MSGSAAATPYAASPSASDWSTASGSRPAARSRALMRVEKPKLSMLKQEILSEEEYTDAVSDIIKRDFFGSLLELEAGERLHRAVQQGNARDVEESVQRMREIMTPTPRRGRNLGQTPGRTPFQSEPSDTPTHFSGTPRDTPISRTRARAEPLLRYDPRLSLDQFQSRYTSEDNSSFAEIVQKDNTARRVTHSWAWDAEQKANVKAIRGREARERLVEITQAMVSSDPNGEVRMIEGGAGRPGERMLVVQGVEFDGATERLLVKGSTGPTGQLLIKGAAEAAEIIDRKGKGKVVEFIDYDKEDDDAVPIGDAALHDLQVPVDLWKFTNRNSFMFPPDADVPYDRPALIPDPTDAPLGEPKGIRHHATRLPQVAAKGSRSSKSSSGMPSPSHSRINAAITGTPYPLPQSTTPRVSGFSFVDALPTPRASTISAEALQDLMTWGTIDSTPVVLRSSAATARSVLGQGGGPFHVRETSKREALAHSMGKKAKKSLGDRASSYGTGYAGAGLRRSVLDSTHGTRRDRTDPSSPRNTLSPGARKLLERTGSGRSLGKNISTSEGWDAEEQRIQRARARAREVESREAIKRARWSPSPAPSLGFDPDRPDDPA